MSKWAEGNAAAFGTGLMDLAGETATVPTKARPAGSWRLLLGLLALLVFALVGWYWWSRTRGQALWQTVRTAARRGDWPRAETALAALAWYRPHDVEARRLRIQAALKRNDLDTAAQLLEQEGRTGANAAQAQLALGRIRLEQYRLADAESAYRACLALDPQNADARHALVVILGVEGRTREQQAELFAWAEERGPSALEALRLLAPGTVVIPATGLSRTSDEGQILERALAVRPNDSYVRPALADFYRTRGRLVDARQLLESWLLSHHLDAPIRDALYACLLDAGDPRFETLMKEATPGDERSGRYWLVRAQWLREAGRDEEALKCLYSARGCLPRDPGIEYRIAQVLRTLGRDAEADEALIRVQKARELVALANSIPDGPADPVPLVRAGRLCVELGRTGEARLWFNQALRIDPACTEARQSLEKMSTADTRRTSAP